MNAKKGKKIIWTTEILKPKGEAKPIDLKGKNIIGKRGKISDFD